MQTQSCILAQTFSQERLFGTWEFRYSNWVYDESLGYKVGGAVPTSMLDSYAMDANTP